MSGLPAIRLSFAVVVSISGAGLGRAPGAPCGQRVRVVVTGRGLPGGLLREDEGRRESNDD